METATSKPPLEGSAVPAASAPATTSTSPPAATAEGFDQPELELEAETGEVSEPRSLFLLYFY
jgi:hypothetical protein